MQTIYIFSCLFYQLSTSTWILKFGLITYAQIYMMTGLLNLNYKM